MEKTKEKNTMNGLVYSGSKCDATTEPINHALIPVPRSSARTDVRMFMEDKYISSGMPRHWMAPEI